MYEFVLMEKESNTQSTTNAQKEALKSKKYLNVLYF